MRWATKGLLAGAAACLVALGVAYGASQMLLHRSADALPAAATAPDPALVARGRYLARAGDCVACHTGPGGAEFAGGLAMATPMGLLYSTNITPDPQTGIGHDSYADFARAVRHGVSRDGRPLYPAMPFPSYAIVTEPDMRALYAYFMSEVKPVVRQNTASTIPWPLSIRWPLAFWPYAFARQAAFAPRANQSDAWNRGAYLVEGLAHCGACHTPRGLAFEETALNDEDGKTFLSGAIIDGWLAKSLRGEVGGGLGRWSPDDIVKFLKTGRTDRAAAFGGMADVIHNSTQYLTDPDLMAIAVYVKSLPAAGVASYPVGDADLTYEELRSGNYRSPGAAIYVESCATCHRFDGDGYKETFPALAQNPVVLSPQVDSLIHIVLEGARMPQTYGAASRFAMPGFARLNDQDIADVLSFIRGSWGNGAPPVMPRDVARMRRDIVPAGGTPATGAHP